MVAETGVEDIGGLAYGTVGTIGYIKSAACVLKGAGRKRGAKETDQRISECGEKSRSIKISETDSKREGGSQIVHSFFKFSYEIGGMDNLCRQEASGTTTTTFAAFPIRPGPEPACKEVKDALTIASVDQERG
uniref:Uncharacterized protein n=1 Tax=Anopheles farauti TaxID=69004 RepID=A0A182QTM1_9DIPT